MAGRPYLSDPSPRRRHRVPGDRLLLVLLVCFLVGASLRTRIRAGGTAPGWSGRCSSGCPAITCSEVSPSRSRGRVRVGCENWPSWKSKMPTTRASSSKNSRTGATPYLSPRCPLVRRGVYVLGPERVHPWSPLLSPSSPSPGWGASVGTWSGRSSRPGKRRRRPRCPSVFIAIRHYATRQESSLPGLRSVVLAGLLTIAVYIPAVAQLRFAIGGGDPAHRHLRRRGGDGWHGWLPSASSLPFPHRVSVDGCTVASGSMCGNIDGDRELIQGTATQCSS